MQNFEVSERLLRLHKQSLPLAEGYGGLLPYVTVTVTRVSTAEKEQYLAQIERLLISQVLHGSESLCKLLRYLAEHAVEHPGSPLKEYQIATEVFGRPADFDPQTDSIIRVQAGRLRMKLAEYYKFEGEQDPIQVELPKGTYVLSFHLRPDSRTKTDLIAGSGIEEEKKTNKQRDSSFGIVVLSVLLALAAAAIVFLIATRSAPSSQKSEGASTVFASFWNGFLTGPEEPWVIFSNGAFVGRPETGMRYFDSAHDSRDLILDHYTGVGEVLAVHALDQVFASLHRQIRVKRGSLVSLDDVKNNDLIFVGSPAENLTLREIPNTEEFVFRRLDSGARKGDLAIINVHPQSGEPSHFLGSPSTAPLSEDYSIIAFVRGLNPAKSAMILAGTTTIGTQAAVEYVCQQDSLENLVRQLHLADGAPWRPFEAVLRVKVTRGVPVESKIVALRKS